MFDIVGIIIIEYQTLLSMVFKPSPYIVGTPMLGEKRSRFIENSTASSVALSVRPATIRRGSQGSAYVHIHGSGVKVRVSVSSSYPELVVLDIVPRYGKTPFTASIVVHASLVARVGIYYLDVTIINTETGVRVAQTTIPIFVVDYDRLTNVLSNIDKYRRIYRKYGIQYALLKIIAENNLALTFTHLKLLYEALVGHRISNGTVGDLLSRLLRKGLLVRIGSNYCFNEKLDLETAKTVIDVKRALNGIKGARTSGTRSISLSKEFNLQPPRSVKKVLHIASELIKENYWKAVDLIAHTLIGVRETGVWFLWVRDYFIYGERKSRFLHYFRSQPLSELLKSIGLREGFMYEHVDNTAKDLIKRLYHSYTNARRLHYLLKERGWFEYSEPLILELSSGTGSLYIAVKKLFADEVVVKVGNTSRRNHVKRYLIYPGEHVDEENELTYFYRPSNLY